jgi:hypothetical protein
MRLLGVWVGRNSGQRMKRGMQQSRDFLITGITQRTIKSAIRYLQREPKLDHLAGRLSHACDDRLQILFDILCALKIFILLTNGSTIP